MPVPTIAWVSRHLGWWLSTVTDHLRGRTPRKREDVEWPGEADAVTAWLRGLRDEWLAALDGLTDGDLDRPAGFPGRTIPSGPSRTPWPG